MKRYFIEDVKCGIDTWNSEENYPESVLVSVKYNNGEETGYIICNEICMANGALFYKAEHDLFYELMQIEDGDELIEIFNNYEIRELDGIDLCEENDGSYKTLIKNVFENENSPAAPLMRYLLALVRCKNEEEDELIERAIGRYVDEIEIPPSDIETEYVKEVVEKINIGVKN